MENDPWIEAHSPIDPAKLHALGYVNLVWNGAEYWLSALLSSVAGLRERHTHIFTFDMGDTSIITRIKAFAAERSFDRPMQVSLEHGLAAYDICRINRNHLNHYALASNRKGDWELRLHRVARKPVRELVPLPDDLEDIRRVGEEIYSVRSFIERLTLAADNHPNALAPPLPESLALPKELHKMRAI